MKANEALDQIKDLEAKTQELIEQAKKQGRSILHDAEAEKVRTLAKAREEAGLEAEKLTYKMKEELIHTEALARERSRAEIAALEEKAKANMDQALEFLKKQIK